MRGGDYMANDESLDINVEVTIEPGVDEKGKKTPGYTFVSSVYEMYRGRKETEFFIFNTETDQFEWVDTDLCELSE